MPRASVLSLLRTAVPGARGATSTPSPVPGLHALSVHISRPGTHAGLPGLGVGPHWWVRRGGRARWGRWGLSGAGEWAVGKGAAL